MTNNKLKRESNKNIITSPKDLENRFCRICNLGLVMKEPNVYSCPRCNVSTLLTNTQPDVKIRTNFPVYDPTQEVNKHHVIQSENQKLSRSEYFIQKNMNKRNEEESNDPHLKFLKQRNDIRITNVEIYSYEDSYQQYDR